jgi:DNA polymerase/3'-5' exonuclease PolX
MFAALHKCLIHMERLHKLITILREAKAFLAMDGNYFSWSSWRDQNQAISEIDSIITEFENGSVPDIGALFAPTCPIQEISLSSGWGHEFIELAERFDKEYEIVKNQS